MVLSVVSFFLSSPPSHLPPHEPPSGVSNFPSDLFPTFLPLLLFCVFFLNSFISFHSSSHLPPISSRSFPFLIIPTFSHLSSVIPFVSSNSVPLIGNFLFISSFSLLPPFHPPFSSCHILHPPCSFPPSPLISSLFSLSSPLFPLHSQNPPSPPSLCTPPPGEPGRATILAFPCRTW